MDLDAVRAVYTETWSHSPWVRILPKGALPETRYVRGSMFCDLGLVVDPRTGRLIILSAIDNLCRGASGQALANANLMCGLRWRQGSIIWPHCRKRGTFAAAKGQGRRAREQLTCENRHAHRLRHARSGT